MLGGRGFSSSAEAVTDASERSFQTSAHSFGDRLRDALRRRLAPNTALHPKQLAHAIGATERGVNKILAGDSDGHAVTVAACIDFFWRIGDRGFVAEIYRLPVQALLSADELAREKEAYAREVFERAMPRRAAGGDRFKLVFPLRLRVAA